MTNVTRARRQARLSRALGLPLTPKSVKYFEKRPYPPGEHGRARRRTESDYAVRLKEKQRLRAQYALREKQLHRIYLDARKEAGLTGESMVELLEMRLDALVLRSGFARTILQARQAVTHRHILVDGKIVDRPSYRVKVGQTIQVKPRSQAVEGFQIAAEGGNSDVLATTPSYLSVELDQLKSKLVARPKRSEVPVTCEVQMVVEYYAR
ncbi:30S ribosomal protein S4 [Brachybacterium halotolerans subsp. kimchii]|uniref:30S ribosomal protein S4 n=1 Tax=Brachybacterium TaxID=43668 RepID=UPI001E546CFC|nr:30S ribosomal protein S4 [Brachybacterium halotolerans]MCG7309104.1 30S ribosomal protein S4 [Brachybacterium sp. ACRRE]UEJ83145.1 30S ribosomal protein S4 [Brachybacterium halotolerans subsp. kimchii]